jgi:hypothetical protein
MLKGIARVKKTGVAKKLPISPAMLARFGQGLKRDSRGTALWACDLVTFFGYIRRSNTTTDGPSPFGTGKCLRVCDVTYVATKRALRLEVQESKTRQVGKGTAT